MREAMHISYIALFDKLHLIELRDVYIIYITTRVVKILR